MCSPMLVRNGGPSCKERFDAILLAMDEAAARQGT